MPPPPLACVNETSASFAPTLATKAGLDVPSTKPPRPVVPAATPAGAVAELIAVPFTKNANVGAVVVYAVVIKYVIDWINAPAGSAASRALRANWRG